MRQQGPGAKLEHDLAKLGIVDPVIPFAQRPDTAGHDDWHRIRNALSLHNLAQNLDARVWILRLERIFGVGQAIVPARQPWVFIDNRAEQMRHFVIGALPQQAKSPARADNRQIMHIMPLGDFGELVWHACAAGDPGDHALRL